MEKSKLGIGWAASAVAALVLGGGFYLSQVDSQTPKKQTNQKIPEGVDPNTVTGYTIGGISGQREVVISHKEFTGAQKGVLVTPEKPKVKEGFSGQREVVISHKEFTGAQKGVLVTPEKPKVKEGYQKPWDLNHTYNIPEKSTPVPVLEPVLKPEISVQKVPMIHPVPEVQSLPTVNKAKALKLINEELVKAIDLLKKISKETKALSELEK